MRLWAARGARGSVEVSYLPGEVLRVVLDPAKKRRPAGVLPDLPEAVQARFRRDPAGVDEGSPTVDNG